MKLHREEKISNVLRRAMLLLVLMIMVCSVYSLISFRAIGKNLTTFYNVEYNTTKDQMEIRKDVQTIIKRMLWALICEEPEVTKTQTSDIQERFVKMDSYVATIATNLSDSAVEQNMISAMNDFKASSMKMLELVEAGDTQGAVRYYESDFLPISEVLADALGATGDLADAAAAQKYEKNLQIQTVSTVLLLIISAFAVLLALALVERLTRRIVRPIEACGERLHLLVSEGDLHTEVPKTDNRDETGKMLADLDRTIAYLHEIVTQISKHLGEIADGDLRSRVDFRYEGDFASLNQSMATIYDSLNDTMIRINQSSAQVSVGAGQVSDGAQSLSQGATEQASTIQELSASLTEVSRQIGQSADNASVARTEVDKVGSEIAESNAQMQHMISAMNDISGKSNEISKIIKTIDDIAFQTNILALNAAVEAARAGSAGKGFAVVADEVRNLAGKSAESAKNTEGLIEETVSAVERGAQMANTTAQSMLGVVDGASAITDLIDRIAVAANEQADSVKQVTAAVSQISSVVQNNAATAEQSAAASEELNAQAQILKEAVGKFKLKNSF